jgi:hypothetical protein
MVGKFRPWEKKSLPLHGSFSTAAPVLYAGIHLPLFSQGSALTAPLVVHNTRIYKCAMKKIIFNGQRRNRHFLIVIYHSSLVKGAMKAARLCKLRNGV